ncbi:hydroxymethylpyrimidine/phosphomethylpyrimidine kinase [Acidobacteriota bacterium]
MYRSVISMDSPLLSIAGFDPTSGAGVLLDLQVFFHFGHRGLGIPTALTVQNSSGVGGIHSPPPEFLLEQFEFLTGDIPIKGIKIGMIGEAGNLPVIRQILESDPKIPIIIDPVFKSSSGTWLMERAAIPKFIHAFRGTGTLITPNLEEVRLLTGFKMRSPDDLEEAASLTFEKMNIPCLIKGGHFDQSKIDLLYDGKRFFKFRNERIEKDVHGTGCLLSSSLLCLLAQGLSLEDACAQAIGFTHRAIVKAGSEGRGAALISFPLPSFPLP